MTQNDTHNTNDGGFSPVLGDSDPLIPFDVRDQTGRRGMYILIGSILALLAFATVLFIGYQPGTRDRATPPRIKADNQPFKVEPANPGGVQTPDQDKSVYDVMAGKSVDQTVVTTPGAETPIDIPKTATIKVDPPKTVAPKVEVTKPVITKPAVTAPPKTVTKPTPKPVVSPAPVSTGPVSVGAGDYVVQVASVRSRGAADDVWTGVSEKFDDVIASGLYSDIVEVDLGDKGIFYRLRIAGLSDKAAARQLCNQFKARGQACLVAKR